MFGYTDNKDNQENQRIDNNYSHTEPNKIKEVTNSYEHNYEQQQIEKLEQNAPKLNNPVQRNINKKAIAFIITAILCLIGLIVFAIQQFSSEEQPVQQQVESPQTVSIPDVPELPPPSHEEASAINIQKNVVAASKPAEQTREVPVIADSAKPIKSENRHHQENIELPPSESQQTYVSVPDNSNLNNQPEKISIEQMRKDSSSFVENVDAANANNSDDNQVTTAQTSAKYLQNKDKLLLQGTYLRCVLETKIVSDIPGFTSCVITEPVYSASGKYVVIPKGSKVLGQYGSSTPTSERLSVIWDRIITPDGIDITLKAPGVDNLGAAGHVGKFESHWSSRLASALLISMISDTFKYTASRYGKSNSTVVTQSSTTINPYESETANTVKQMAINQLERNNARPNTVTIIQGSLINIYAAQDVDFSRVIY